MVLYFCYSKNWDFSSEKLGRFSGFLLLCNKCHKIYLLKIIIIFIKSYKQVIQESGKAQLGQSVAPMYLLVSQGWAGESQVIDSEGLNKELQLI